MNRKLGFLFLLAIVFSSCNDGSKILKLFEKGPENLSLEKDFKRIEVEGDYSLSLPKYMKENKELHADASLAYQHAMKEVATMVLVENKHEMADNMSLFEGYQDSVSFIENFTNIKMYQISSNLGFPEQGVPVVKKIGELPAAQVWLEGQIEGVSIAYFFSCVDAGNKVYLVLSYTTKEKKVKFEDTFLKIADSFLLLSPIID